MSRHTAEAATQDYDDLTERVERFLATWEQGQEPTLAAFLPEQPPIQLGRAPPEGGPWGPRGPWGLRRRN